MPRRRPRSPRRRRLAVALAIALAAVGVAATAAPTVVAQEDDRPDVEQFGGFIASARSNALNVTYDLHGLLPVSPVIDLAVPEALATLNSGPVGYGLASLTFPGPLIANLADALALGGTEVPIPEWPIRSEAFYPSGPRETATGGGGTTMSAITDFADSRAQSSLAGLDLPPVMGVGGVEAKSQTTIEDDLLVARTRSVVTDLSILGGLVHIDSVTTDLVAVSNGVGAASDGTTSVAGASVLGLPVRIDAEGIHFTPVDDDVPDNDDEGLIPGLGDLGLPPELGGLLDDITAGLNDVLGVAGGTVADLLDEVFELTGIQITVGTPTEVAEGGTVSRTASGLSITIDYDGSDTPLITDLLGLIPTELLPDDNLGPVPFSPQSLVALLSETHIIGAHVAPGRVSAQATEAFVVDIPPFEIDPEPPPAAPSSPAPAPSPPVEPAFTPDFASPVPDVPETQVVSTVPASSPSLLFGLGLPALIALALLLGLPFFAIGGTRLANATLAAGGAACPTGLDQPDVVPGVTR